VGRIAGWALVALSAAALGSACTSSPSNPSVASLRGHGTTTTAATAGSNAFDQDMIQFARCLRQHGIDEPDPFHRPGHQGLSVAIPQGVSQHSPAMVACQHFIAPIVQMKQAHQQQFAAGHMRALTNYAQCMRHHDIDMLDPDQNGSLNLGNVPGITSSFGRYSPQFRAADTACRHLLPRAVHDDGTGP
jgi:hypothetical protein